MSRTINLIGQTFNRLTVVEPAEKSKHGAARWKCTCSCGRSTTVGGSDLRHGRIKSCGCLVKGAVARRHTTHGKSYFPEYGIWESMKGRCLNVDRRSYSYYGGRGISVCQRWLDSFENFFADMGPRPSPAHSLERTNNNGNYEPGNCKWATGTEQANNKRNTFFVEYQGRRMGLSDAIRAAASPISNKLAVYRISRGWSVEDAINRPHLRKNKNRRPMHTHKLGLKSGTPSVPIISSEA